ncbi:MAG: HAD family phosphatase, partial [Gammaproteobacteria bacterium]|nr:HAD family phosphatase [Gammaproteobacteria bacterium]
MSEPIESVVFDIGWVLIHLRYPPLHEFLCERGARAPTLHATLDACGLAEHECGRLAGEGFMARLNAALHTKAAPGELHTLWTTMFDPDEHMLELARRLSATHRVYLLSNIGDLHWAQLSRAYRLHELGHGAVLSYLAGVMKPAAGIYAEAERRFKLTPARTVFIDDRADNIAAAQGRGWHGIVHRDYAHTCAALARL